MKPDGKNILAVISYPFLPATTGGEISTLNILKYLSHQHKVTVFTVEPYKADFDTGNAQFELIFGMPFKVSRYVDLRLISKLRKLMRERQTDWLFFDQPWFGWLMLLLKLVTRKKIFIRSNNIEYLRFRSMGKWFWQMLYIYEKWTYRIADLVIFVSDTDRQKAIYEFDLKPEKTLLTPYGVEENAIPVKKTAEDINRLRASLNIAAGEKMILFFSTLSYYPNYEAAGFIADEIYPLLQQTEAFKFKIIICGKGLPETVKQKFIGKPEMVYLGFVDDIKLYIDAADVMINPLLSGGGVKTKAIDTLARNQRVISTQNGAEGIDPAVCGNDLIIVPDRDWKAFASSIVSQVDAPRQIPTTFYETYGWSSIIQHLSEHL
ncbi:MAG: glycosyltransferase family 4 protein [Bacteroidia bacterium]|jgi:glycosyltransferase involved in cell wall biosynthesis